MRILVTGGAGYIGSITTRYLLDAGHSCVVLDSLDRGHAEAVDPRARLVVGSVGDRGLLGEVLPECDAVMHLAGLIEVAESEEQPERYQRVNADEPLVMLEEMAAAGTECIVYSSTAAVYGQPQTIPITEDAATTPVSVYGHTKLAFEHHLDRFAAEGIRSIRFRYFNVAGAWPDGSLGEAHDPETHLIPRVLTSIRDGQRRFEVYGGDYPTRDGTCVRDYIHVMDLARAHLTGLERLVAGHPGGVYNLGNGEGFTNLEIVAECGRVSGSDIEVAIGPRRRGDPAELVASAEKAAAELGWRPQVTDLSNIVRDAHTWHLAHPHGYG